MNVFKIPPSLLTGNMSMFPFITVLHMLDFYAQYVSMKWVRYETMSDELYCF